ncbi:hypothetical protein JCM17823_16710 [Halorubrum gandharaense]
MNRRTLLAAAGTMGTVAVAGCVGDGGDAGDGDGDDANGGDQENDETGGTFEDGQDGEDAAASADSEAAEIIEDPELVDTELVTVDTDDDTSDATVSFGEDVVYVEGTVVGETGCHAVELAKTEVNGDGSLEVVVAAVDDADPEEMCTQALTPLGYVVEATFDDGIPGEVTVVHDDTDGRDTVARESLDD